MKSLIALLIFTQTLMAKSGFHWPTDTLKPSVVSINDSFSGFFISENFILTSLEAVKNCLKSHGMHGPMEYLSEDIADMECDTLNIKNSNGTIINKASIVRAQKFAGLSSVNFAQTLVDVQKEIIQVEINRLKKSLVLLKVDEIGKPLKLAQHFDEQAIQDSKLISFVGSSTPQRSGGQGALRAVFENKLNLKQNELQRYLKLTDAEKYAQCENNPILEKYFTNEFDQEVKDYVCDISHQFQKRHHENNVKEYEIYLIRLEELTLESDVKGRNLFLKSFGELYQPKWCRLNQYLPASNMEQFPKDIAFTTDHDHSREAIGAPLLNSQNEVIGVFLKDVHQNFKVDNLDYYGSPGLYLSLPVIESFLEGLNLSSAQSSDSYSQEKETQEDSKD